MSRCCSNEIVLYSTILDLKRIYLESDSTIFVITF